MVTYEEIQSKFLAADRNVETARRAHRAAMHIGVGDEAFKAVTNWILSLMDSINSATTEVEERLDVCQDADSSQSTSHPSFLRYLGGTNMMADNALANSKLAVEQMEKAIASAKDAAGGSK